MNILSCKTRHPRKQFAQYYLVEIGERDFCKTVGIGILQPHPNLGLFLFQKYANKSFRFAVSEFWGPNSTMISGFVLMDLDFTSGNHKSSEYSY